LSCSVPYENNSIAVVVIPRAGVNEGTRSSNIHRIARVMGAYTIQGELH
jgi:hypothetical protein